MNIYANIHSNIYIHVDVDAYEIFLYIALACSHTAPTRRPTKIVVDHSRLHKAHDNLYLYIYICTYTYIHIYIYIHMHVCMHIYIYYVYIHTHIFMFYHSSLHTASDHLRRCDHVKCVYIHKCIYTCVNVYTYILNIYISYISICIYRYIYIHI